MGTLSGITGTPRLQATVTDWVAFTPSFVNALGLAGSGIVSPYGYWRRVGSTMEIQMSFRNGNSDATGSGEWLMTIPEGLTIDTTKALDDGGAPESLGQYFFWDNSAVTGTFFNIRDDFSNGSSQRLAFLDVAGNIRNLTGIDASDGISLQIQIPIAEWANQGTLNVINDQFTSMNARAKFTVPSTTGPGAGGVINFSTAVYNTGGGFSSSSGTITCNFTGTVFVDAIVKFNGNASANDAINLRRNGSTIRNGRQATGGVDGRNLEVQGLISVTAGDTIDVVHAVGGATFEAANELNVSLAVTRIAEYTAGQAVGYGLADTSAAGLVSTAAQSFAGIKTFTGQPGFLVRLSGNKTGVGSGFVQVEFNTETFDNGGYFDASASNWKFVCPTGGAGLYQFDVTMEAISNATAYTQLSVRHNSTDYYVDSTDLIAAGTRLHSGGITLQLAVGDTVSVWLNISTGSGHTHVAVNLSRTMFSGAKVS